MRSAMLLAAALPGRSMIDSGSPSEVAHSIGWNPNPALKCAAAPALFSECTSTSVESMSKTTPADPAVSAAALPHSAAHRRHSSQKQLHRLGAQAPQRAIQRRVRRHPPEQHRLGPQMLDVAARLPAAREHQQRTNQHLAPITNRRPLTAGRHNSRQRLPKPQTVSETPQNEQTPMRRDLIAAPRHPHITSTATVHLGDAPSSGSDTCRDTRIIPHRRGFSANAHPLNAKTRERSGLDDTAKQLVADFHRKEFGTNVLARIRQHPQRDIIHRALGY